jgi:hypothetical protein
MEIRPGVDLSRTAEGGLSNLLFSPITEEIYETELRFECNHKGHKEHKDKQEHVSFFVLFVSFVVPEHTMHNLLSCRSNSRCGSEEFDRKMTDRKTI